MRTAILILNWNGKELLQQFLPSVIQHTGKEATIYIVDNASTDDSVAMLRTDFPTVSIIENIENGGYAKGYNDAIKQVSEDLLILMNSDIETSPGWLVPIINAFNTDNLLGAAQPKILDYKNKNLFEYAGAAGGFIDMLGYPYCRGRIFQELEEDNGQFNDDLNIFWASGACLAVRRAIFNEVDGLDEDFFAHQEEIDLCWRINNLGYHIKCLGKSHVYHVGGATLNTMNPKKTFYNFRNTLFALTKNVPGARVILFMFIRLILDGIAALKFLLEGKPKHFAAVFKAHISFYSLLSKMFAKRKRIHKNNAYYSVRSIVFQHFLLGKNKWEELK